jgi:hypothetical protein
LKLHFHASAKMGAIDPQLAQLVEEDLDADATKQIPSLSQAVPPQPQHPVCDLLGV